METSRKHSKPTTSLLTSREDPSSIFLHAFLSGCAHYMTFALLSVLRARAIPPLFFILCSTLSLLSISYNSRVSADVTGYRNSARQSPTFCAPEILRARQRHPAHHRFCAPVNDILRATHYILPHQIQRLHIPSKNKKIDNSATCVVSILSFRRVTFPNTRDKMSDDQEFIRTTLNEWKLSKWYNRFIGKYKILNYMLLILLILIKETNSTFKIYNPYFRRGHR